MSLQCLLRQTYRFGKVCTGLSTSTLCTGLLLGGLGIFSCHDSSFAQDAAEPAEVQETEAAKPTTLPVRSSGSTTRKLAPGVMHFIQPDLRPEDTFEGPMPLDFVAAHPELAWQAPDFPDGRPLEAPQSETLIEKASNVSLRHSVYGFEFGFKPVRMIEVDVPQPSGKLQRKLIWYMLYSVRYEGGDLQPKPETDQFGATTFPQPQKVSYDSRRIFPSFVLIEKPTNKEYLDRIIPAAKEAIANREKVGSPLYDTMEMQTISIPKSTPTDDKPVWGIATWENVDPRIDYFAVQAQGLTNAFRIETVDGQKLYRRKTLQLNFWRPGDTLDEITDKIRFGVPALADSARQIKILQTYGLSERLDYLWIYR
jgi:hypothetical protein